MAKSPPTTGDLVKARIITSDEVEAAVMEASLAPDLGIVRLGKSHYVDVAAAVATHPFASAALSGPAPLARRRRNAIKSAIILARPIEA